MKNLCPLQNVRGLMSLFDDWCLVCSMFHVNYQVVIVNTILPSYRCYLYNLFSFDSYKCYIHIIFSFIGTA